jgi:hypothetical protein
MIISLLRLVCAGGVLHLGATSIAASAMMLGVELQVSPTLLSKSGDEVQVRTSATNSTDEPKGLWPAALLDGVIIGAYSPASLLASYSPGDVLPASIAPIKYQWVEDELGLDTRVFVFSLLNLRDEDGYTFALVTGNPTLHEEQTLLAKAAQAVQFHSPLHEVLQLHLALTGVPGEMRLSWVTGSPEPDPVELREQGQNAGHAVAVVETTTYGRGDMCGVPEAGWHDPGFLHTVVFHDLDPNLTYEYSVGGKRGGQFKAPISPNSVAPVRIAVFGDMGTAANDGSWHSGGEETASLDTMTTLARLANTDEPISFSPAPLLSLVLHIGDITYAQGYDTLWDEFGSQIEVVASKIPWMLSAGNHERDAPITSSSRPYLSYFTGNDSGGECGVPYAHRFRMPAPADDPQNDTPWYSLDHGPVHFTVMSTEHDFGPGSPQFEFIANDFEAVDRVVTPWLVLLAHRPFYVDSEGPGAGPCPPKQTSHCNNDQPVAKALRDALEELMMVSAVDLAVYGHHHSYQRTCKLFDGKCLTAGNDEEDNYVAPVHIVVGSAGYDLSKNIEHATPKYFEYIDGEWSKVLC